MSIAGSSTPTKDWVIRVTLCAAVAAAWACVVLTAVSWRTFLDHFSTWPNYVALISLVTATAHLTTKVLRRVASRSDVLPLLVLPALANICFTFLRGPGATPTDQPWTMSWTVLAVCLTPLCLAPRIARVWTLCTLASFAALRVPMIGWGIAAVEVTICALGATGVYSAVQVIRRWYEMAELADRSASAARRDADEEVQREQARAWWDRLLHDKIIGALMLGSRATSPVQLARARATAEDALEQVRLAGEVEPTNASALPSRSKTGELTTGIRALADDAGLELRLRHRGSEAPPLVVRALLACCGEAFANVANHAQTRTVGVEVVQSRHAATVSIRDHGVGFDPTAVDPRRAGLQMSMPGHLAELGGSATVRSAPGAGTEVTLSWTAGPAPQDALLTPKEWTRVWWIGACWVAWHVIGGLVEDGRLTWGPPTSVGLCAFVSGYLLSHTTRRRMSMSVGPALAAAAVSFLAWTVPPAPGQSWRLWFVGALDPVLVCLALRGRPRQAVMLGGFTALGVVCGYGRHSPEHALYAVEASLQLVLLPWVAWTYWRALARARARLWQARQVAAEAERRVANSRARQQTILERARLLDVDTLSLLRALAEGEPWGADRRKRAKLAEAANRDQLVARPLLAPDVVASVAEARQRGVEVHLTASAVGTPCADAPDREVSASRLMSLRTELVVALRAAHAGDGVTARWHPESRHACATLTVSRPDGGAMGGGGLDDFLEFDPVRPGNRRSTYTP